MEKVHIGDVRPFAGIQAMDGPLALLDKALALRPLEEAAEVFGAWQKYDDGHIGGRWNDEYDLRINIIDELADCIQACVNLASALETMDLSRAMARCEKRSEARGRY